MKIRIAAFCLLLLVQLVAVCFTLGDYRLGDSPVEQIACGLILGSLMSVLIWISKEISLRFLASAFLLYLLLEATRIAESWYPWSTLLLVLMYLPLAFYGVKNAEPRGLRILFPARQQS